MPGYTPMESDFINRAYDQASTRVDNLITSHEKRPSQLRQLAIDGLRVHQQKIENVGFFEKEDFSPDEIQAAIEAANALVETDELIDDAHEITLMELESDLAQLVQKLSLDEYRFMLKGHWVAARRYSRFLPHEIPEEVHDEFNVAVFAKAQGRLNQIAYNVRDVARLRCLNSDDYAPADFAIAVFNAGKLSAKEATDNYITLQRLKAAERAAREASEVSIGGQIWDVVGWDSPTDFLADAVLTVLTGGASRVVRWGRRLKRVRDRAKKAAAALERSLDVKNRALRMERRALEIRKAAERLKKARNTAQLPKKIAAAFNELKKARGRTKLIEAVGKQVTADYIRIVTASVAAKGAVLGSANLGSEAGKQMARLSILAYLDGTQLGSEIKELRGKISYTLLIKSGFNSRNQERLMAYFGLLVARDFLARTVISLARHRSLRVEHIVDNLIDSAAVALETMLLDVPVIAEAELKRLGRTIMSTIRAVIGEIGKEIAKNLIGAPASAGRP